MYIGVFLKKKKKPEDIFFAQKTYSYEEALEIIANWEE